MSYKEHAITRQVADLVEPVLDKMGVTLVDVDYLNSHGRWVLRLYIDKDGGVSLDDCANVSRQCSDLIDVKDIISHSYIFEVSSPGLDRPLVKDEDFYRAIGKKIKVKMIAPVSGRRNFTGQLLDFKEGNLILRLDDGDATLDVAGVKKANLVYDLDH